MREIDPVCIYTGRRLSPDRFSIEHVVPKSVLPKIAHNDLHLLFPCDREINSRRGNKKFAPPFGTLSHHLEMAIGKETFTPPCVSRGAVARACLYAAEAYDVPLEKMIDWQALHDWLKLPVSNAEDVHMWMAFKYQRNFNEYIV